MQDEESTEPGVRPVVPDRPCMESTPDFARSRLELPVA